MSPAVAGHAGEKDPVCDQCMLMSFTRGMGVEPCLSGGLFFIVPIRFPELDEGFYNGKDTFCQIPQG